MPLAGACQYFLHERDGEAYCEGCRLIFPDKLARREFVYRYCAHPDKGFRDCPVYRFMENYYERQGKNEKNSRGKKT